MDNVMRSNIIPDPRMGEDGKAYCPLCGNDLEVTEKYNGPWLQCTKCSYGHRPTPRVVGNRSSPYDSPS